MKINRTALGTIIELTAEERDKLARGEEISYRDTTIAAPKPDRAADSGGENASDYYGYAGY